MSSNTDAFKKKTLERIDEVKTIKDLDDIFIEIMLERIDREIPYINVKKYSHNIIGFRLGALMPVCSKEQIKNIVKERGLDKMGWEHLAK